MKLIKFILFGFFCVASMGYGMARIPATAPAYASSILRSGASAVRNVALPGSNLGRFYSAFMSRISPRPPMAPYNHPYARLPYNVVQDPVQGRFGELSGSVRGAEGVLHQVVAKPWYSGDYLDNSLYERPLDQLQLDQETGKQEYALIKKAMQDPSWAESSSTWEYLKNLWAAHQARKIFESKERFLWGLNREREKRISTLLQEPEKTREKLREEYAVIFRENPIKRSLILLGYPTNANPSDITDDQLTKRLSERLQQYSSPNSSLPEEELREKRAGLKQAYDILEQERMKQKTWQLERFTGESSGE